MRTPAACNVLAGPARVYLGCATEAPASVVSLGPAALNGGAVFIHMSSALMDQVSFDLSDGTQTHVGIAERHAVLACPAVAAQHCFPGTSLRQSKSRVRRVNVPLRMLAASTSRPSISRHRVASAIIRC
jgi:hypothetical protein